MAAEKDTDKDKRPEPPEKPALALAMKSLGDMQVSITKAIEELEVKRQAEYVAAIKAWEERVHGGTEKEKADKHAAEFLLYKRETARLKRKLEKRPCQPTPELHPMAIPAVIERVLKQQDKWEKDDLKNFCLICKAWVLPCRSVMFAGLSDLKVATKQRVDGLIDLLTSRQSLIKVVKAITFTFAPSDASVVRSVALKESLPSPVRLMLLLTVCREARKLSFENIAAFGATRPTLHHIADRVEACTIDPKGFGWHGKEVQLGTDGEKALFGDWPRLSELTLNRVILQIHSSETFARGMTDSTHPASCPLAKLSLEKVRLLGRISDVLEGARGHLTHLSLLSVGSLRLRDLCSVLAEHGVTLTHLTLVGCDLIDVSRQDDDVFAGISWGDSSDNWLPGQRPSHGAFDRALSACLNLVRLSIEPGSLPVLQPVSLLRPLAKLESLEFSMRGAHAYDYLVWLSLMGLAPVLNEEKRKLKKIHFGHDWPSDDRRLTRLRDAWSKLADDVKIGRLARLP